MQPFRLRCYLATPVALNHPWLHLDGVVAHLVQMRLRGRDYYTLPTKVPRPASQDFTRHRYQHVLLETDGLTHASISWFHPHKLVTVGYYKRFEDQGFPVHRKKRVESGSGHYRSWMLRWAVVPAEYVDFYGVGDLALLGELLADLTHLGNDTRVGWGKVARWELEPIQDDRSLVWQGVAMRPIPVRYLASWSEAVPLAWRPPYWAAENVDLCAPPGAEVALRIPREREA